MASFSLHHGMVRNIPVQSEPIYGLGVDTGGTFTDSVIVDLRTNKVLAKAKAKTTYDDLSIGLGETIDNVLRAFGQKTLDPSLVGVSTTLATNSILEGRGGQVGLIGLGWKPEPGWELGARMQRFLPGGHDVRGNALAPLDMDQLELTIQEMAPHVDSIVVSGLFSVHNPFQEAHIKKLIREKYGLPVVVGHELTAELGIHERTVTAVLNARLIPVLSSFLEKVVAILQERDITAPVMVFKGDGTLMNLRTAMERPVDTILSGPAASAMGGRILSGLEDCIVIDIGGTSTDIAVLEQGLPRVARDGSAVGRWRTRVEAVDMWTAALGGDSEIRAAWPKGLIIGPRRVVPLCFATSIFPELVPRMKELGQARFLFAANGDQGSSDSEIKIMRYLIKNGPRTLSELREDLSDIILLEPALERLRSRGAIAGIGLTPTDVLHTIGTYTLGDVEAACLGVDLFAPVLGMDKNGFIEKVLDTFTANIADELIKKILSDELGTLSDSPTLQGVLDIMNGKRYCSALNLRASLATPVVGLGAPASAYVTLLEDNMGVKVIIPPDHEVGNAVGAVCGQVSEYVDVFVYPRGKGYGVYSAYSAPISFQEERDAVTRAKAMASEQALERARRSGGLDPRVELSFEEERVSTPDAPGKTQLAEMRVRARAVGRPIDI